MRLLAFCSLLLLASFTHAEAAPLKVVASFSVLGDLVKQVGGNDVTVTVFVGPNGDTHVYEPKPADAKAMATTDLLIVNGLGLEGWMDRLKEAAHYKGPVVVAAAAVTPLASAAEGVDPHAWQSVPNAMLYVQAIEAGLVRADPAHATDYQARATAYLERLKALDAAAIAAFAPIARDKRIVITTHDAFQYYGQRYGITFLAPEGINTEAEADAQDVAKLIQQIRKEKTHAVFIENMNDPRLLKQIADEAGVDVSGELYSDALSPPDGPAATYTDMIEYNTKMLSAALANQL